MVSNRKPAKVAGVDNLSYFETEFAAYHVHLHDGGPKTRFVLSRPTG